MVTSGIDLPADQRHTRGPVMNPLFPALLLPVVLLVSCTSSQPVEWQQVKEDPVTYYPAGFAQPEGQALPKGNWVADEKREANFFIPEEGTASHSASELHADALEQVSPSSLPRNQGRVRMSVGMGVFGSW